MKELTPKELRCTFGACPAVYEQDDNIVVVVGKRNPTATAELISAGKIAPDEEAVFIDRALLKNV